MATQSALARACRSTRLAAPWQHSSYAPKLGVRRHVNDGGPYRHRPEIEAARRWWSSALGRPLAVVGPAGAGKTVLARRLGHEVMRDFGPQSVRTLGVADGPRLEELRGLDIVEDMRQLTRRLVVIENVWTERALGEAIRVAHEIGRAADVLVCSSIPASEAWASIAGQELYLEPFSPGEQHALIDETAVNGLDDKARDHVIQASNGSPLLLRMLTEAADAGRLEVVLQSFDAQQLPTGADASMWRPNEPVSLAPVTSPSGIDLQVRSISGALIRMLAKRPDQLHQLSPRQFEQLVADLYAREGFTVELTKSTRDGGVDLFVVSSGPLGRFTTLVEAKRYRADRPVGVGVVRQLYGVVEASRATAGIVATTSFFTADAKAYQRQIEARMSLRDYLDLQAMLKTASMQAGP